MKANLRMTATFDPEVSAQFNVPGLESAIIVDDQAGLLHEIKIEYAIVKIEYAIDKAKLYRRLNYTMTNMYSMKKVFSFQNNAAQELLYKIALNLSGTTLTDRGFEKGMFILPKDEYWDDVMPTDKPDKPTAKPKKESKSKKEESSSD